MLDGAVDELRGDVRLDGGRAGGSSQARTFSSTPPQRCRSRSLEPRSARSTSRGRRSRSPPRSKPASVEWFSSRRPLSTASRSDTRSSRTTRSSAWGTTASRRSRRSSSCAAVRTTRARGRDRPAEDVRRPRAARRVRDPVRLDPRGPPDPDPRRRRESLPAARRRGPRRGGRPLLRRSGRGRGAEHRRRPVRHGARGPRGARSRHAGSGSRLQPVPARPAELALRGARARARSRRSPSGTTGLRTRTRSSRSTRRATLLGWEPRLSNAETLCATYDWYLEHRDELRGAGTTHRVPWDQGALGFSGA